MKLKIFSIYHKKREPFVGNDYMAPLLVGMNESSDKNFLRDDLGENISNKNPMYNELTGIYWVYKNYSTIGNPDYVGFCHYRRYFSFCESKKNYYEFDISDPKALERIEIPDSFLETLGHYDFVAPIPSKRKSVLYNYKMAHGMTDIIKVSGIIDSFYPDYAPVFQRYFSGKRAFFHNMFIFPREIFFEYCEWIFGILFRLENLIDPKDYRMYISERLTGVFIQKLEEKGLKCLYLPTVFLRSPKKSFKDSLLETKNNLKNKDMNLIYALKPLIIFFIPSALLKKRRQKST